jgi:S-adenosylmethionine-diacylgycerolhomoserine-N-methlytransferase
MPALADNPTPHVARDPGAAMDRIYKFQRHIYDATRKFFLFGRDGLIASLRLMPHETVVEVGCGTARNLILMARRYPGVKLYGIDASQEMLDTAGASVRRAGLAERIHLARGYAEALDVRDVFALAGAPDRIVFSYALSMIPPWREAMEHALETVRPGGTIHIVDFWDQARLPRWFRWLLTRWLALFHVHHRPELMGYLESLRRDGRAAVEIESIGGRYAFRAVVRTLP